MAGGGSAPPMKMSDVLLLIGVSLLVGTLFIQEWDQTKVIKAGEDPLEGTSRTFSGDILEITVETKNGTDVEFQIYEDGEEVTGFPVTKFSDSNNKAKVSYESEGGKLSWKVVVKSEVDAEVDVDLRRAYFLNYLPYVLGALITAAGVAKKKTDLHNEDDTVLDAIIEGEDSSK